MLATRTIAGNAHLLPIDRNDPTLVLYLPLWYPYGDLTGNTIYSYDKNRHACTVSNAVWGTTGRTFDGADDDINCGNPTILDNLLGDMTVIVWINPTGEGENSGGRAVDKGMIRLYMAGARCAFSITVSTASKTATSAADSVPLGSWTHVAGVFNSTNVLIYTNLTLVTGDATAGPVDAHAATNLYVGDNTSSNRCFNGIIGEVLVYNRALPLGEITRNYQTTKWRYT